MQGEAIQIITAEEHSFYLNEAALKSILAHTDICNKHVVIISVVGAFRKGKSFLLNFLLRYLKSQGDSSWLKPDDAPLEGFHWRGGSERDTTGILLWNEIFLIPLPSGEEVALLLMDTQGTFDSTSTVKECATVFALSTLISSVQIYNLSQNIQEDDLQHLEFFAEYGRLALENSNEMPFQKLVFLVRDWNFPYDAPYGETGGRFILDRRLQISESQHPQLQQLRNHIQRCFKEVTCFLMPHPGQKVAASFNFDGRLSDIGIEFKSQLQVLVTSLLSPLNLIPKKIDGHYVTGRELIPYFKAYVKIFQGDELPEPKTVLEATAEANNLAALAEAKEHYRSAMDEVCGGDIYINHDALERKHLEIKDNALFMFQNFRKMGGEELSRVYQATLEKEIEEMWASFTKLNESKHLINAARTPGALFFIIIICYFSSGFLNMIGLYSAASLFNFMMGICLLTLSLWCYIRFSGEYVDIGYWIDNAINLLWNNVVRIVSSFYLTPAVQ